MIQIITNNIRKYEQYSKREFFISKIDEFQAFDNYEITIIDISDNSLWFNKAGNTVSINQCLDFKTIKNAISRTKRSKIVIIFPQNIYFKYSYVYKNSTYVYDKSEKIKDIKENFISIINENLIDLQNIKINYGMSYTKINGHRYKSDFSFINVNENGYIIKAENKNDITLIQKDEIVVTTMEIDTEEKYKNLLISIFPNIFEKRTAEPEWIKSIDFYTDSKCKEEISKIDEEIEKLKLKKGKFELEVIENSKYKSILYESGEILAEQVNKMLSKVFQYDISQFKDTYEEDGLIKLEDVTFIIETKGLNNEISGHNVSDACNHLIIYEDKLEEEKITENAKCLFFVAYERNKNIQERAKIKDRLEKIAKANNTLIVDTRIFLKIFEDFLNEKIDKEEIKEMFKNAIGVLEYIQRQIS